MIYLLFILSAYLLYKESKNKRVQQKIVWIYASVFLIAILYNVGEFVGAGLYELGIQF